MKNVIKVGVLVGFMTLGLVGAAFAEQPNDKSILGTDEFSFNAPITETDIAAQKYVYDQERLKLVGTEGGDWQFNFNAPETKADLAAKNYNYDPVKLKMVGTNMGYDEYIHSNSLQCPLC